MQRDVEALVDGVIGGCVATAAMSVVMLAAEKTGVMDRQPPEEIAEAALEAVGVPPDRTGATEDAVALLAHFGFGATTGALFGVLHRRLRPPIPPVVHGIVFGSLIWAVSYKGWIPAMGIMPPPERDQPGRPATMLLAHWVYGGTLGALITSRERPEAGQR